MPESQRGLVDLRSDTVTRPTPAMYEAMARAELGDDVLGDEPTVARLEGLAAERLGKEGALFVPSGTMGNQIALAVHCERGDALLAEEGAHILFYECGGPAVLAQAVTFTLRSVRGVMDPEDVERHVVRRSLHTPGTTLLCVENTHNRSGGAIVPLDRMAEYREVADRHEMAIHLDGARIFNASVALGVSVRETVRHADSVSFCLSKGLASPIGSVLCGSSDFIAEARRWRKRLGGGMRQAGLLAACGIVSLEQMVDRLADDHRRARTMAEAIAPIPGLRVDLESVQTNMVLVQTEGSSRPWIEGLADRGILALPPAADQIRLVLHKDVDDVGLERAIDAFRGFSRTSAAG